MKTTFFHGILALALLSTLNARLSTARAQGTTAFSYNGQLNDGGTLASGNYDLTFTLFDVNAGGVAVAGPATNTAVTVSNGLFATTIDFGSAPFTNGASRWLELAARTNGGGAFITLSPRQQLTPTPYALYALTPAGPQGVTGTNGMNGTNGINGLNGTNGINGLNGTNGLNASASAWGLTGNAGTAPGTNFVGTTDNQPLEIWVNNSRAFRLEPGTNVSSFTGPVPNVIGGSGLNSVGAGYSGSTIAGGGTTNYIGAVAYTNKITGNFSTIGGGGGNTCSNDFATVAGGLLNNSLSGSAAVGGGRQNTASGSFSTVAGGEQNVATGSFTTVAGGAQNTSSASGATVCGGTGNFSTNVSSAVGGGDQNVSSGQWSTVPGGFANVASALLSFAAGRQANATNQGAFVWGGSDVGNVFSTNNNSWTVRASGGVRFFSNSGLSAGVFLAAGGTSWAAISDRNAKKNFQPVDVQDVLARLAQVPIQRWNYQWEDDTSTPHIGPMAQDFKGAFYPGRDDKSITTLEFDGVELAAIQGLNEKLEARSQKLEAENADLKARLDKLEQLVNQHHGSVK